MEGAKEFLQYTGPNADTISIEKMMQLFNNAIATSVGYQPNPGILKDLISSGNLSKITNTDLRKQLSLCEARLADARAQENIVQEHRTKIKDLFGRKGNLRKMVAQGLNMEPGNFENNSRALLQDIELENYLTYFWVTSRSLNNNHYKNLSEVNVQILESINREIR